MTGIINEMKKLNLRGMLIAMLICFVLSNVVISFLFHDSSFRSQSALEDEKNLYVETLASIENDKEDEHNMKNICEEKIAIIDYCISNNIPYQQLSVPSNLAKNTIAANFVIIFIVLLVNSLITVEFRNDTWKNIIVITNGNARKILLKKKMAEYLIILGTIVSFLVVAVVYGAVVYRNWSNISVDYVGGAIVVSTYNQEIINMLVSLFVKAVVYGSMAFLLAVIFKEKKIAVIGITLLILFENTIYGFLSTFHFSSILPYRYLHILENVCDYQMATRWKAMGYTVFLLLCVNMLAVYSFKKKIYQVKS